jgi:phage terminase large subunit-like protein
VVLGLGEDDRERDKVGFRGEIERQVTGPAAKSSSRILWSAQADQARSEKSASSAPNVQCAVCDEIGSHRTSEVYDALVTAMGKRSQPFLLSISTATGNIAGIGKQLWDYGLRVLQSECAG